MNIEKLKRRKRMSNFNHLIQEVALNGTVKNRNLQVFRIVCTNPGKTAGEIALAYKKSYVNAVPRNEIAKRINDLRNFGLVKKTELKKCPMSGKMVATWTPTGKTEADRTVKTTTVNKNLNSNKKTLVTEANTKSSNEYVSGVLAGMVFGSLGTSLIFLLARVFIG